MLRRLQIKNYALIDSLDLKLDGGLTIITGETGAGKSIMLGALSLLLGERADAKAVAGEAPKAVVEATFSPVSHEMTELLQRLDVDAGDDGLLLLRREVTATGRSRAFVNDQPVNLSVLGDIARRLVNIHSQHSNVHITDPARQLAIIDAISGTGALLAEYRANFNAYVALRQKIKKTLDEQEENRRNREMLLFQKEQLDRLKPKRGELAEIERRFDLLSDADEVREHLREALGVLAAGEEGAIDLVGRLKALMDGLDIEMFGKQAVEARMSERLEQCYVELRDIEDTLETCLGKVNADPAMLARMSARMNLYYENVKAFRVSGGDALADFYTDLQQRLSGLDSDSADISELKEQERKAGRALKQTADRLTAMRREGAGEFAKLLLEKARPLGLHNLDFEVELTQGRLTASGQDQVEFLCSFNKNQSSLPLAKTASGGERARLLLAIEDIMSERMSLPTVIFDEIDTGVSGEIAGRMGRMMHEMGDRMQVLAITHLPQVAAKGDAHIKVYKTDTDTRTVSRMSVLDFDQRINEIAGMLAGSEIKEAARENALALLNEK